MCTNISRQRSIISLWPRKDTVVKLVKREEKLLCTFCVKG